MSEPVYLVLIFGGLALLLAGLEDDRLWMFPAAGALFGLAYLTRPEGLAYEALLFVFASIRLWGHRHLSMARTSWKLGLFLLPFVLLSGPYVWYLHIHTGQWLLTGKTNITVKMISGAADSPVARDQVIYGLDSSGEEINWLSLDRFRIHSSQTTFTDSETLPRRVTNNIRGLIDQLFGVTNFWWGLTPLVAVALFKQPWDPRRLRHEAFLFTNIFILLLTFLPVGSLVRYFTPAFPILLLWTARGALDLGDWLRDTVRLWRGDTQVNRHVNAWMSWMPAGMVAAFLILTIPVAAHGWKLATFFGDKEAGLWLKAHTPAEAKIMTQELGVAMYADRRYVPSPNTDWIRFLKYARARNANYLVVRDFKLAEYRPELAAVLQKGAPELELVFTFEEPHMPGPVKTFVYRIASPVSLIHRGNDGDLLTTVDRSECDARHCFTRSHT